MKSEKVFIFTTKNIYQHESPCSWQNITVVFCRPPVHFCIVAMIKFPRKNGRTWTNHGKVHMMLTRRILQGYERIVLNTKRSTTRVWFSDLIPSFSSHEFHWISRNIFVHRSYVNWKLWMSKTRWERVLHPYASVNVLTNWLRNWNKNLMTM